MSALDSLAALAGIAASYTDVWGQPHAVSDETKAALLAAMRLPTDDPAAIAHHLDERRERPWLRILPPVAVLAADRPGAIALALPASSETVSWTLTPEQGVPMQGAIGWPSLTRVDSATIDGQPREIRTLPIEPQPAGYYTLSVAAGDLGASTTLVVAPDGCWLPPRLRPGADGRIWGIAVQLYGLRSARNWAIGDFTDLAILARRVAPLGIQVIGLNPLHAAFPEAPERFSPYAPSSRLFLNMLYLDIEQVDGFADCAAARSQVADPAFQQRLAELRAASLVDYPGVAAVKRPLLELLFRHFQRSGDRAAFAAFRAAHGVALERHATFEALAEHFAGLPEPAGWWGAWPRDYRDPASAAVQAFAVAHAERIDFFAWLQWQADRQLAAAHAAARRGGMAVGLYRDLAVGADRAGAETWLDPTRYADGASIGAPPDLYNPNGQDWGLPPLHPDRLREDAYRPLIELLRANMARAGALRIDHAFALTRLFWVPAGHRPDQGAYVAYPFEELLAVVKLESQRNRCLVVGEDLGTVPPGFREACTAAGVLSYRLLYFERDAEQRFTEPAHYPALALAAASTHDLPTIASWWRGQDIDLRESLGIYPAQDLIERERGERASDRVRLRDALAAQHLIEPHDAATTAPLLAAQLYLARSRAALLMIQLEDALGLEEQANLPATTDQHPNWQRKLPVELAALTADDGPLAVLASAIEAERPRHPSATGPLARPTATYRIQLHKDFTFHDAAVLVPYLAALGISHLYTSPYLTARPGSQHGYDIVDHASFNPELGGEAGFRELVAALERHGMGHVLDFVPNHMGIGGADNSWWLDVLEWGEASRCAGYFDIDWRPRFGTGRAKLLLPILGGHYGDVLEAGELRLGLDAGSFSVWYFGHRLPICPIDYPEILDAVLALAAERDPDDQAVVELAGLIGDFRTLAAPRDAASPEERPADALKLRLAGLIGRSPALAAALGATLALINGVPGKPGSFGALHRILEAQSYRVAFWRVAGEINYRRFFDINDLAGLRMENRALFDQTHRLVFELIDTGRLHGLRIDHIDGLADPAQYCRRIQDQAGPELYLVVEKILATHEHLPADWPIAGTTGYDVLNQINGVFVATAAERGLDRVYRRFTGCSENFDTLLYQAKTQVLQNNLSSELQVLALDIKRIADADPKTRDYTFDALRRALTEVIAWFPVYRTYVTAREIRPEDRQHVDWAIGLAIRHSQFADLMIYEFLRAVLTLVHRPAGHIPELLEFVRKFQQLTGPVMAKGMEDTSFYRYTRLLSLNEVGGDPRRFGLSVAAFHHLNERRLATAPHGMVATATHDTKRGEDVRARLNLLSDMPAAWGSRVTRWSRINRLRRRMVDDLPAPTRNDEYLIYQTLVGAWPLALKDAVVPGPELEHHVERLVAYLTKALREAKERTSWTHPNQAYESAVTDFVRRILDAGRPNLFLADFLPFQQRIAQLALVNGLAQTVLKLTIPGIPDIYQGTELWDLSLVDPDNRRPVDYQTRRRGLAANESIDELLATWSDGRIKQRVVRTLLHHRRVHRELYDGAYEPLAPSGARAEHVLGFRRRANGDALLVLVPVLFARLTDGAGLPVGRAIWQDTRIGVGRTRRWRDLFTGDVVDATEHGDGHDLPIADALARLPVACLEPAA